MKHIVALIPARGGSKTVKKKNLQPIYGMPMIGYAITAAMKTKGISRVYVSSDDQNILDISELYGAEPLLRPEHLASDTSSTESVVAHFFTQVKTAHVVLIQPTSPMLTYNDLALGLKTYAKGKYDSLFSACRTNDVLIWDEDGMYPLNYDPRCRGFRQSRKRYLIHENGAFFIFSKKMFARTGCRMGGKIGWSEMPYWRSFQVDTKEDLEKVRILMTLKS